MLIKKIYKVILVFLLVTNLSSCADKSYTYSEAYKSHSKKLADQWRKNLQSKPQQRYQQYQQPVPQRYRPYYYPNYQYQPSRPYPRDNDMEYYSHQPNYQYPTYNREADNSTYYFPQTNSPQTQRPIPQDNDSDYYLNDPGGASYY